MSGTLEREGLESRLIPMLREAVAEAGSEESDPGPVRRHRSPTRVKILVLAATAVVVVAALARWDRGGRTSGRARGD